MGIVKIDEALHDEVRKASAAMSRSINAQAEFWLKLGMLAELYPTLNYQQLQLKLLRQVEFKLAEVASEHGAA